MPDEEQKLTEEAESYIKEHKCELIERFANPKVYHFNPSPISLFMAGSPGAGKTEVSKRLIEQFTGNLPVRIDADDIRTIFPNYNGANSHIFQRACTIGVNKLFDHVLHNNINAILDGTFAYERAMENIERSLKHKRRVVIYYLFQDPIVAWTFTKAREEKRRQESLKGSIYLLFFVRARENVSAAKEHFGDKVELEFNYQGFYQKH